MGEELGPVSVARDGDMAAGGLGPLGPPYAGVSLAALAEHRPVLEKLRDILVERETIDRSELERLAGTREVALTSATPELG